MADGLRDELEPDGAGAARLRGRHRQAPGQAARSPRPPERDRGAVRKRADPRQGPRDHARQPDARTRSPSSSCSSAAPTSPKAAAKRSGSPASKTKSTSCKRRRSDRRRAGSHESRAQGAGELNGRKGTMTMARKIYPYSLDRKDAKVAGVASTIGGDDRDRPDLHPHRLRRRRDLHQLQADPDRLRRDRHLPRGAEEAGR